MGWKKEHNQKEASVSTDFTTYPKGIVVNTYNSDRYQSATKTASVTVNSAEETVETIIRKIADLFKGWFGW